MDRSLKWRTAALVIITLLCVGTIIPSLVPRDSLPRWFTKIFSSKMSMGLDLQGGLHLVYSIDLDKAVDDRASGLKSDIESRLADDKVKALVRTPAAPLGAVTVTVEDGTKRDEIQRQVQSDYGDTITMLDCPKAEAGNAICLRVSSKFADTIKKAALTNAVATIR